MKCLSTGMRREAVQEERTRAAGSGGGGGGGGGKGGENNEMESSSIGSRLGFYLRQNQITQVKEYLWCYRLPRLQ